MVLNEYSAQEPPAAGGQTGHERGAEVARRIARRTWARRAVTVAAAVALLVGVGGFALSHLGDQHQRPTPATSATASPTDDAPGHLPEYYQGGKLAASAMIASPDQTSASFAFTPTSYDFFMLIRCGAGKTYVETSVKINSYSRTHMCSASSYAFDGGDLTRPSGADRGWARFGVKPGKQMTVTMDFDILGKKASPMPSGASIIGIYVQMPWDKFPFPPQPSTLKTFTSTTTNTWGPLSNKLTVLDATSGPVEVTLPRMMRTNVQMRAPGVVNIYVDGILACKAASYDWSRTSYDLGDQHPSCLLVDPGSPGPFTSFRLGQKVTLTIVAEHFTVADAWRVEVYGS